MRPSPLTLGKALAQWRQMQLSGLKQDPDQVRTVGSALAARLPQIIAAAVKPVKRGPRRRRVLP